MAVAATDILNVNTCQVAMHDVGVDMCFQPAACNCACADADDVRAGGDVLQLERTEVDRRTGCRPLLALECNALAKHTLEQWLHDSTGSPVSRARTNSSS